MDYAAKALQGVEALVMAARKELARRIARVRCLNADYFGEAAWDILLHLYVAAREERLHILTKEVIGVAGVPSTTALRWMDHLDEAGEIARTPSKEDGRVTHVALTAIGLGRVERALSALIEAERRIEDQMRPRRPSGQGVSVN